MKISRPDRALNVICLKQINRCFYCPFDPEHLKRLEEWLQEKQQEFP